MNYSKLLQVEYFAYKKIKLDVYNLFLEILQFNY